MAELVRKEDMPNVIGFLRQHLPESVFVYYIIKRITDGYNPGFNVWKSRSHEYVRYNVIVVTPDKNICKNPFYRQLVHMFCVDPAEIVETLSYDGVLDFTDNIQFPFISECDLEYVSPFIISKNFTPPETISGHQYLCLDEHQIPVLQKDEGLTESNLTLNEVDIVASNWHLTLDGIEEAILDWIHFNFSTVCLFDKDGKAIAWGLEKIWGDIGMLFVSETYRRQGLGKYIMSQLARSKHRKGDYVYAMVEEDNESSKRLHKSLGFKKNESTKFYRAVFSLT